MASDNCSVRAARIGCNSDASVTTVQTELTLLNRPSQFYERCSSGGSRHSVWGGPRGAEVPEVEHRRRDDQGAELGRGAWRRCPHLHLGWGLERPFPPIFSIFYFKRRILVDFDVLNMPVIRTRAWHTFTFISTSLRVTLTSMLQ